MVTFLYFLSLCFHAVLLQLYEDLEDEVWLVLCEGCGPDLLGSLECAEGLLCKENLLCGVSHW